MIDARLNAEPMKQAIRAYADSLLGAAQAALIDATDAAELSARATIRATTKRHTGALEESWRATWQSRTRRRLTNYAPHAGWINDGTKPHRITARRTQFLKFQMNGTTMFRRSVYHPGTKARPFIALAYAVGQMAMKASGQAAVDHLARAF